MKTRIRRIFRVLLTVLALSASGFQASAISLWVGQSYTWDFSSSVMGLTYNMSVSSNGGYLSITGSGFYRNITPTQYFGGTATVTAEWDYCLYHGDTMRHQRMTLSITCNENPVSISPTSITLAPGETYQLGYRHAYDNQYVGAANAYFSGGNSSFSVTSSGLVTAKSPGSGYVNVYSKVADASKSPSCRVTVKDVEPTGASVGNVSVLADQSADLSVTLSPSNATVKSRQWYVKSGSDVVSISGSRLTGLKPGKATIYCMVNGSVRSNDATVTVTEPKLTKVSTVPAEASTGISVFVTPSVTYSHTLSKGSAFASVTLRGGGSAVNGTAELSGSTVRFLPAKPLTPMTDYTLTIPSDAVRNKWGSAAQADVTLAFRTGALEKATVEMTPVSGSYLMKGETVKITSVPSDAKIYYTTDGTDPTTRSSVYSGPIKPEGDDITIKAIAVRDGYETSETVTARYYRSQSEITGYYPNDGAPLFNYGWAAPHIKLSGFVKKSNNFRRITLTDDAGNTVAGEPLLTGYMITFVPEAPLENGRKYTMDIPRDAVKTTNGEVFRGFNWTFTTPTLPSAVAMRGDETAFVLSEDGVLRFRGMEYLTLHRDKGSYDYTDHESLAEKQTGVDKISGGYTHMIYGKDNSAKVCGFPLCGEWGTTESIAAIGGVKKVVAGFQTTAIIGEDNSLWMCGRNDFHQLGDGTDTTRKKFVKVADDVIDVALGNGYSLYVDTNNEVWAIGRNHRYQLGEGTGDDATEPQFVADNAKAVFASASGYFSACITTDNRLLTWGDNEYGQLGREAGKFGIYAVEALRGVVSAALGEAHVLALTEEGKLYAWGSNSDLQTADSGDKVTAPTLLAENVKAIDAGPHTSLILYNNGKVTGRGRRTHSNFGSGAGSTSGFTVAEGRACSPLSRVIIEPARFEAEPESRFALVAVPMPYTADYESVEWTSDRPEIARVDGNGAIQTGQLGEANITARFTDRFGVTKEAVAKVICTENPENSGLGNLTADGSDWSVLTDGCAVIIENASVGEVYTVYNVQGLAVGSLRAESDRLVFNMNQPGVYIVRSADKAVKVSCR